MLELANFGHKATSKILLESRDKSLLVTSWTEIIMSSPLFQNTFILMRPSVANFAEIIKTAKT